MKWFQRLGAAAIAASASCMVSAQPAVPPCLGDFDGDGVITVNDVEIAIGLIENQDPAGDVNEDGSVDWVDLSQLLEWLNLRCQPGIVEFGPQEAAPGEEVCFIIGNWFDPDCPVDDFNDFCGVTPGGVSFDFCGFEVLPTGELKLIAKPIPFPPGALPGPPIIVPGDGLREFPEIGIPGGALPEPIWVWEGKPGMNPPIPPGPGDFTPPPLPPDPTKKFETSWFFDGNGALCFDLPDVPIWEQCDEIFLQFRAWCDVRRPDVIIPEVVICEEDPTTIDVARAICDAIRKAFAARNIDIKCEIIRDLTNGVIRVCISYCDCAIDQPAWQTGDGTTRPFAYVCIRGAEEPCDDVCQNAGPTIVDLVPNQGAPGDIVCAWVDPQWINPDEDPKNLCTLFSNGVVGEAVDIAFDPDRNLTKIFIEILQVPEEAAGIPGRLEIKLGIGECNDNPDPDPGACHVEPVFSWVPLEGFPVIAGGDITFDPTNPTAKRLVGKWFIENGRQCLIIPRDFTVQRCDVIEVLIRLWCPVRTPDINIPRIRVCRELDAQAFGELLCNAITDAFLNRAVPIEEIDCKVEQLDTGEWKVSIGYTDCDVTGGVAETGLPWTQVAVCPDPDGCDEDCSNKKPPIEVKDFQLFDFNQNGLADPGEQVCLFVCNLPPDKGPEDLCFATKGGILFLPEFIEDLGDGVQKIGATILPFGPGAQAGPVILACGEGIVIQPELQIDPRLGVELVPLRPFLVWQPDPGVPPVCPEDIVVVPNQEPFGQVDTFCPGGDDTVSWEFDPTGSGKLCLEITDGLNPGEQFSIFLRAYCRLRSPDVTIPSICNTGNIPLSPEDLAQLICDVITQAYIDAGINAIDCTVDTTGPFPVIKLGYTDCAVDGPRWGAAGTNPSTFKICPCPPM